MPYVLPSDSSLSPELSISGSGLYRGCSTRGTFVKGVPLIAVQVSVPWCHDGHQNVPLTSSEVLQAVSALVARDGFGIGLPVPSFLLGIGRH